MVISPGRAWHGGAGSALQEGLSRLELASIIATVVAFCALVVAAYVGFHNQYMLLLAGSVGGIGGLVHEIAQSGGKILFFQKRSDGIYLGSIAGLAMGAVAGILVIRGFLTGHAPIEPNFTDMTFEAFLAGLALKGVVEAAGGGPQ